MLLPLLLFIVGVGVFGFSASLIWASTIRAIWLASGQTTQRNFTISAFSNILAWMGVLAGVLNVALGFYYIP